ncbi:MAG: hypothetical protein IIU58_04650, partial [Clostridia bacterium]|nr:hypothetical protein [Clostridia bacterium]
MMLPLAAAVFLHECAHLAALRLCGGRIRSLRPAPFGLCIVYDENSVSLGGELLVSVAGCAVNIGSAVLSLLLYWLLHIDILNFGIVSLLAAALNLLPVQPLDGGRLVYLVLSAWRGPDFAGRVTATCTYLAAFPVFLLASYLLLTGQAGIYPLL